jgi:hypothetical protein
LLKDKPAGSIGLIDGLRICPVHVISRAVPTAAAIEVPLPQVKDDWAYVKETTKRSVISLFIASLPK